MEKAKKAGKIRFYGLSNISEKDEMELISYKGKFVSFQNEYSLACRKNEKDLINIADKMQMTPMTWGSLGQGILTGKYNKDNVQFGSDDRRSREIYVNFHGEKLLKNLEIVDAMKPIADAHKKPISAVAIRFILDYLSGSIVLCGAKRPDQILGNVEGADWKLTDEELFVLNKVSE